MTNATCHMTNRGIRKGVVGACSGMRSSGMRSSVVTHVPASPHIHCVPTAIILALLIAVSCYAQTPPGTWALVGGDVETVSSGRIAGATVVLRDGRIVGVGPDVAVPSDATVVDCEGMTIYPGFFDAGTRLGLIEIGAVEETRDENEMGDITPHALALTAVNPNSVAIPVTRVSGVTTALTAPTGGLLPGTAAVINLLGYTPQQMSVGNAGALIVNFPRKGRSGWWDERKEEEIEKAWRERMEKLDEIWDQAELYAQIDATARENGESPDHRTYDNTAPYEAMMPAVRGRMPVIIEVSRAADIDSALAWIARRGLTNVILGDVDEGWRVADRIAAAGIPCIVGPVLSIPSRHSDRYDKAYANPGLLSKAGVRVALRTSQAANVRNLPFNAGFAVSYGMDPAEALRAITLTPAELFGVDDRLGSIEVGKEGTLFVCDGDPFEPATEVRHLFIGGRNVPLESRHTRLNDEFLNRDM